MPPLPSLWQLDCIANKPYPWQKHRTNTNTEGKEVLQKSIDSMQRAGFCLHQEKENRKKLTYIIHLYNKMTRLATENNITDHCQLLTCLVQLGKYGGDGKKSP